MKPKYPYFHFWCQQVLPLVYDDTLSYYETLCKVVEYLNNMISGLNMLDTEMEALKAEVAQIQQWIDNFTYDKIDEIIQQYIVQAVYFGLTDAGYFVAYIPHTWQDISFGTTGLDTSVPCQPEYGHLVLKY